MKKSKVSAKRETILQAALELFADKGYSATSTKDIATRSGVAEGLLFYYFDDKKGLLQQVIRTFSFFEKAREQGSALDKLAGVDVLLEYGRLYLTFLDRNRPFLMLIWSPELMRDESVAQEVNKLVQEMANQASQLLGRALGNSSRSRQSLEAGAAMLLSSLFAYASVQNRIGKRSSAADEAYIREVTGIVTRGLQQED